VERHTLLALAAPNFNRKLRADAQQAQKLLVHFVNSASPLLYIHVPGSLFSFFAAPKTKPAAIPVREAAGG
jgi:hypothetical protein